MEYHVCTNSNIIFIAVTIGAGMRALKMFISLNLDRWTCEGKFCAHDNNRKEFFELTEVQNRDIIS